MDIMPQRCVGCAFTAGTEANQHQLTQMVIELSLTAREPFFCHANAPERGGSIPEGQERLCRGFVDALVTKATCPPWQRAIAAEALRIIEEQHAKGDDDTATPPLDQFRERILSAGAAAQKGIVLLVP